MTLICQELSHSLTHVRLKAHILTLETVDELGVLPGEAAHMREVNVHGALFLDLELVGDLDIVSNLFLTSLVLAAVKVDLVGIGLVVWVFGAQHKAIIKVSFR